MHVWVSLPGITLEARMEFWPIIIKKVDLKVDLAKWKAISSDSV